MSRRARLATVVRVAELRETVARGEVVRAAAEAARTRGEEQARRDSLAAGRLDGTDLQRSAAVLGWRAGAVRLAATEAERAAAVHADAVAVCVDASRRTALLTSLAERLRAEHAAALLAADQRTADDSTAARHLRSARS